MSAPYLVEKDSRTYLVVDDITTEFRALLVGALFDEALNEPIEDEVLITADRPDVFPRALPGGLFAVSGYVERIKFPTSVTLTFSLPHYRPVTQVFAIAAAPLPVPAGSIALRPFPIRLQGRVVKNDASHTVIAGATVASITPGTLALRTPIHFPHASGVTVRERALTPAGAAKALIADAAGVAASIQVNSTASIVGGTVLRIGNDIDAEYVIATGLGTAPGEVLLNAPLRRSFANGTVLQRVTKGAIGASTTLSRSADAGDGLLLLGGPLTFTTYEINDGAATEYAVANALSGADGFYRLDGIGGVRALDLRGSAAALTDLEIPWTLDYRQPVNVVSFRLST